MSQAPSLNLKILSLLAAVWFAVAVTNTAAQSAKTPIERLRTATVENSIDGPDMKPWHLKLSFQTFGPKQVETNHGSIEEWWAPGRHRISIASPTYSATEVQNESGLFYTNDSKSTPDDLDLLRRGIVHPMPQEIDVKDSSPELHVQTFGKLPLDCISLTREVGFKTVAPIGLFPTYCLAKDLDILRLVADSGTRSLVLNRVGRFAGHSAAIELSIDDENGLIAKGHVDSLSSATEQDGDFTNTSGLVRSGTEAIPVEGSVMAGKLKSRADPIYPQSAKNAHISGVVILHGVIGKDGHVRSLQVKRAPDAALAAASLAAVRKWTYTPYLVHGLPTEVETEVNVNFTFAR